MSKDIIVPHPWPSAAPEITLRDWFAGQAINGARWDGYHMHHVAKFAYQLADAMLKEREKEAKK